MFWRHQGTWYTRYFEDLAARQFHDCHWAEHGKEVQNFWGPQAREAYQCDHIFVDGATAVTVSGCSIIDNAVVRKGNEVLHSRVDAPNLQTALRSAWAGDQSAR